ncbi:hypothetical protein KIPB_010072, partial [Kipferlia bialata]
AHGFIYTPKQNFGIVVGSGGTIEADSPLFFDRYGEPDPFLKRGYLMHISPAAVREVRDKLCLGHTQFRADTLIDLTNVRRDFAQPNN